MTDTDKKWILLMEWARKYCGCHQKAERSFFFRGYQFPLCARCTGIAIGHILAFCTAPFHTFNFSIVVLMLPLAVDGTIQYCTAYESNNIKRILSGILYGFAFTSIVCKLIKKLSPCSNLPD
jgi:Predicted membrane protein